MSPKLQPGPVAADEWTRIVAEFRDLNLLQTWEYGEAKATLGPWRVERALFVDDGRVVGAVQAMVRPLPVVGGGLVWINRGPLWRRDGDADHARLDRLLSVLRDAWLARRFYLRIQPPATVAVVPPGFRATGTAGWASATVDLSVAEETLRKGLGGKWRNRLVKGERSGLDVAIGRDDALFAAFLDAHVRFLGERGFATSLTPDMLRAIRDLSPEARKPMVCLARRDGAAVGSVLIHRYGPIAEYLAGNLTDAGREAEAGHVLLWRAVVAAREAGATVFDLGGMDEMRTPPGILRFKGGVGGTPYRLADEIEAFRADPLSRLVRWRVGRALNAASGE